MFYNIDNRGERGSKKQENFIIAIKVEKLFYYNNSFGKDESGIN